jgi:CHAT domain-containing protein/tetratricopeptide (TPR) repeat protein
MVSTAKVLIVLGCLFLPVTVRPQSQPVNQPASVQSSAPQSQKETSLALEPGKPVERSLAGGETHAYRITLAAGQCLKATVDQRGIDVLLRLYNPNGKKMVEIDSPNSTQGLEIVFVLAEQPGDYRLEVTSLSKNVPAGRYETKIETLRAATEDDQRRVAAQTAYMDAQQFRSQAAAEAQRKAIQRLETSLPLWRATGEKLCEAHTLSLLASTYRRLGQPQQALEYWNRTLEILRPLNEGREEATTLNNIAIVYGDLGEANKSFANYEKVIALWREIGDTYAEAKVQNNLGLAYNLKGEPKKALAQLKQALSLWQKVGNREQEASTTHNIGAVYEVEGDLEKALEHYSRALSLFRSVKNRAGEAEDLNSIGGLHNFLGDDQKALNYYDQALTLWRLIGNHAREALTLTNIGLTYASLAESHKALEHYDQALSLQREVGDRRNEALTLEKLGDLSASLADPQKALAHYDQALQIRRTIGDRWGEARVLNSTGKLLASLGSLQKALEYHSQALKLYQEIGDRRGEARALYGLARAEGARGNLNEARKQIVAALAKVEATRSDVSSEHQRASYLATVENYYEFYIDLLMRFHKAAPGEGFDALALQNSERARARSLLEMLSESHVEIRKGADPLLVEKERTLSEHINAKAQRRIQLFGQKGAEAQIAALNNELNELEAEYEQVQAAIRKASPAYDALTQPQPLALKEIQAQLDQGTMLLEYSLGEERSYVWAVTQNSLKTYELPKRDQIEKAARRVYDLLTARSQSKAGENRQQKQERIAQTDSQLLNATNELSQMVLSPIGSELGAERLVIVADGALQYVPFAALSVVSSQLSFAQRNRTNNGPKTTDNGLLTTYRPLIQDHEIISLPSASALAIQRQALRNRKPAPNAVAVIADPIFSATDERLGALAKTGVTKQVQGDGSANTRLIEHLADDSGLIIRRLKFTRQEADQILAEAPRAKSFRAIDFKANRAMATGGELSKYRYVHFATHGYIDTERPELSAIVLSLVDEEGKPQDGFLHAQEIYNLSLPAELVVLSACETGLGKEIKGEGLVGLTQGFMYAGARRVVVSLWNVNDKATAELMARFYRRMLRENKTPAAALRSAQMEMSRQRQWHSPYYWAAFVLQGEWK